MVFSLKKKVTQYRHGCADRDVGRDALDYLANDVVRAAEYHLSNSHITLTYPDGSAGRKEVSWNAHEQRFIDWGNNYWLYGPESFIGERAGGKWVISARHDSQVIVAAILDRSKHASKFDQVQRVWNMYWQILLYDVMRINAEAMIDLHINRLEVDELEPKPAHRVIRKPDMILV